MREGNQSDQIDARRLAELLRLSHLSPVYHGEHGLRSLKELMRSYLTITKDLGRVMTRVKAIYRSWAIPSTGKQVYAPRHRAEWLGKIGEPGVRRRAEFYYPAEGDVFFLDFSLYQRWSQWVDATLSSNPPCIENKN